MEPIDPVNRYSFSNELPCIVNYLPQNVMFTTLLFWIDSFFLTLPFALQWSSLPWGILTFLAVSVSFYFSVFHHSCVDWDGSEILRWFLWYQICSKETHLWFGCSFCCYRILQIGPGQSWCMYFSSKVIGQAHSSSCFWLLVLLPWLTKTINLLWLRPGSGR